MDGVLWRADSPIGHLPSIFSHIKELGFKFVFATNNGSRTPEQFVERFRKYQVEVDPNQIVTSSIALAEILSKKYHRGESIYAIGERGVFEALTEKGFEVLPLEKALEAKVFVFGMDRAINFEKMCAATLLVGRGAPFFASNSDKTFPTPMGEIPGTGAWVSVITTATGITPYFAGKPSTFILEIARERLGTSREETLVIGDRLETDISGGQAAGMPVCLVLSGVSSRAQGEKWKPKVDIIADNLADLFG